MNESDLEIIFIKKQPSHINDGCLNHEKFMKIKILLQP